MKSVYIEQNDWINGCDNKVEIDAIKNCIHDGWYTEKMYDEAIDKMIIYIKDNYDNGEAARNAIGNIYYYLDFDRYCEEVYYEWPEKINF